MCTARSTSARVLIAFAAAIGLALVSPARAPAGTYSAAVCDSTLGAWRADAAFRRSSPHYVSRAECGSGGGGLTVSHDADASRAGAWGAWTLRAPAGTAITRLTLAAAGRSGGGHRPELLTGSLSGPPSPFAVPANRMRRFKWSGAPTKVFAARLRCRRASGCDRGARARVRVKRIALGLFDGVAPSLRLDGSLLGPGSRRGLQSLEPAATDVGGGVRRFLVQVNDEPVTAHTVQCRVAQGVALRLRPCPGQATAGFAAATASQPFMQGPNQLRVCAADYAVTTAANRTCADRRVRVDNLCPISDATEGIRLSARLAPGHQAATVKVDRGERAVAGRLLGSDGRGVTGARVCIATLARMGGVAERVVATPTTGPAGRFRAALPRGPSREVRVAYWPTAAAALERYLDLRVRARPSLVLRPRHAIRNGSGVRFATRLPGPRSARRRVLIQVRAPGRWLELRHGRTGARGVYRARYRFRATTGRRRYAFRAAVPKQATYPYEAGHSRVRWVTVVGT